MPTMPSTTDQMYFDIFTTALEGGIGYWSECSRYRWQNQDGTENVKGFEAVVTEFDETNALTINRAVISKGVRMYLSSDEIKYLHRNPSMTKFLRTRGEDGDFDAGNADIIVQIALFGEVVYG